MQKKMLVVDDEPMIREIIKEAFEATNFVVHEAKNGREAFLLIQQTPYDCVLSDVRMPGGDGIELIKNIYVSPDPKPKVFLLTGFSELSPQEIKKWGVLEVFDKPFDFKYLLLKIKDAVNLPTNKAS